MPTWVFDIDLWVYWLDSRRNRQIIGDVDHPDRNNRLRFLAVFDARRIHARVLSAWHESGHITLKLQDSRHVIASDGGTDWLGDWIPMFCDLLSPGELRLGWNGDSSTEIRIRRMPH